MNTDNRGLGRREFLRFAGAIGALGALGYASNAYSDEDFKFRFNFNVNIFGRNWVDDNPKEIPKLTQGTISKLAFTKDEEYVQFALIDFDPKSLVKLDIYRVDNKKRNPVAINVRESNLGYVVLPRPSGKVHYSFEVTTPESKGKAIGVDWDFTFVNNEEILNFALRKTEVDKEHSLRPLDMYKGLYPRSLHLTVPSNPGVEYSVYGLESLAGKNVKPNEFGEFFQNRHRFVDSSNRFNFSDFI